LKLRSRTIYTRLNLLQQLSFADSIETISGNIFPASEFSTDNSAFGARFLNKGKVATRLAVVCLLFETRIVRPLRFESQVPVNAPQPCCVHHLLSWAGLEIMPSAISPSCSRAISGPQFGRPVTKPIVPSISFTIYRRPNRLGLEPNSSPRNPSSGWVVPRGLRTASSASLSAEVTTVPSTFVLNATPCGLQKFELHIVSDVGKNESQLKI